MARILPTKSNQEFLDAYGVDAPDGCDLAQLSIKVWDKYGKKPDDEENAPGTGEFVAALVICNDCGTGVEVHRDQLDKG